LHLYNYCRGFTPFLYTKHKKTFYLFISFIFFLSPQMPHTQLNFYTDHSQIDSTNFSSSSSIEKSKSTAMAAPSTSSSSTTNIMLAIFEKKTTSVNRYRPLRNYIAFNYSEHEAQNLEDDLQTLKQYRSDLEHQPNPTPTSRRDLL
jgi:hypothetical protein